MSDTPAKTCSRCGEEKPLDAFAVSRKAPDGRCWWCRACHRAYLRERKGIPDQRACEVCGEVCGEFFDVVHGGQILCSLRCKNAKHADYRRAWRQARYVSPRTLKPCAVCGVETLNPKYCSQRCYKATPPRVCVDCGADFVRHGRGDRCTPCGVVYRAAMYRAKHKPRVKAYPKVTRTPLAMRLHRKYKPRAFVAGTCPVCGDNFVAFAWTASRYCSEVCGKRADRHAHAHRRRARRAGGDRIYRRKVFVRDAWTCRLCGKPVDRDVVVPHPLAATVDHILPLALGGEHVYANVQTAHFLCNSKKADNVTQLSFAA